MTSVGESFVRIRRHDVTWREIDGVIVALDFTSSTYLTTNQSGKVLWQAMIEGTTVAKLVDLLQTSFGISDELAAADVRGFLQLLEKNDLLRQEP